MTEVRSPEQPATIGTPSPPTAAPATRLVAFGAGVHGARHPLARHGDHAGRHLDRLQRPVGGRLPDRPEPVEPLGPEHVDRHHGDGHGPDHRVAQHRPVRRVAAGLPRLHDGARPDRRDDRVLRSGRDHRGHAGQLVRVGRRPRGRRRPGRADRRRDGVHRRLRRRALVHRDPRRLPRLAGRHLPPRGQAGADARPARRDVPTHRRRIERSAGGVAQLVARHSVLCRCRAQHLSARAGVAGATTLPCGRCGWTSGSAWSAAWPWWPASR